MFKALLLTQMLWCLWIYTFAAIMFMRSLRTHDRAVCFSRGRCHLLNFPLFPFAPHPQSQLGRPGPFCFEHSSLQSCQAQFKFSFSAHPFFNRRLSAENIMGSNFVRWILTLCMFCSGKMSKLMCFFSFELKMMFGAVVVLKIGKQGPLVGDGNNHQCYRQLKKAMLYFVCKDMNLLIRPQ